MDVEGAELAILKSVDFARTRIDIMTVEYRILATNGLDIKSKRRLTELTNFMVNGTGGLYRRISTLNNLDIVFERKSV